MADEDQEVQEEPRPAPAKKGKLGMVIAIVVVVALVGGAGAAVYMMKDKIFPEKSSVPKPKDLSADTPKVSDMGPILDVDSFALNLAPGSARGILRLTMKLEMRDKAAEQLAIKYMPVIRDTVIMYMTGRTDAEINNDEELIKRELARRLEDKLGEGSIRNIYFTELLMN